VKNFLKWTGIVVGSILVVIVLGMLGLYGTGQMRLKKVYVVPEEDLVIPQDEASLIEGKRIFQYRVVKPVMVKTCRDWSIWTTRLWVRSSHPT